MKFRLAQNQNLTIINPELLEIFQPILGFEAISVWINIYHNLIHGLFVSESEMIQQMNISIKSFRNAVNELVGHQLMTVEQDCYALLMPPPVEQLLVQIESTQLPGEIRRRLATLVESFMLRRGQAIAQDDCKPTSPGFDDQSVDELTTRFINECNFVPNKQLRERFDLWFEQITDPRLMEELLERTKKKVALEGTRGSCPSNYADKIVRQWLLQGIRSHEDLLKTDREFQFRYEFYRAVEKELGRDYNSLTPAEKQLVDRWVQQVSGVEELKDLMSKAILSGDYRGKGAPNVLFIDKWLTRKQSPSVKAEYTHSREGSELEQAMNRKTMTGLEDVGNEG